MINFMYINSVLNLCIVDYLSYNSCSIFVIFYIERLEVVVNI